jgi:hypothetical protein
MVALLLLALLAAVFWPSARAAASPTDERIEVRHADPRGGAFSGSSAKR